MKRTIVNLLLICLLVCSLTPAAFALGPSAEGTWGDNISWELEDHVLTVTGQGDMEDGCPWEEYESSVEHVVIGSGITRIGDKAFYGFDSIETVDFGDTLVEIGKNAFRGCDDIEYLHLPDTFRTFGASAFQDCATLKYVYCEGPMPSFGSGCLWTGSYISVFYRTDNIWPVGSVGQMISAYGGNMGIFMGNFEDAALVAEVVEEEDEEETEATEEAEETTEATEETVEETMEETTVETTEETQPEVVAVVVTEPETEPTTIPTTEAPTVPETEPTTVPEETTAEETEAPAPTEETESIAEQVTGNSWIGMVLIAGVLTFFIVGALIFKIASRKGGRYTE